MIGRWIGRWIGRGRGAADAATPANTVEIWHNVLWSRYKGRVFSALHALAVQRGDRFSFVQMAETEGSRVGLGGVDVSYHRYQFELLYRGAIDRVPWYRSMPRFFWRGLTSRSDFVVMAGYAEKQNWAQLIGLILRGVPRGVFCDSTLADRPYNRLRSLAKRFFFERCNLIFCYGERASLLAIGHGARPRDIVRRCQAAALPDGYDPAAIPALRTARLSPTPRLIYVGRLSPEKNLERLLEAFARYRATEPGAMLRLVGDGPLRDALAAQARTLGIGDAVVFTGGIDQEALAAEYLAATGFVLPSLSEPWGLVVNEALSYGCPVAVSDACGCVPELVVAGRTGVSFDPLSVAGIVAALDSFRHMREPAIVAADCLATIANYTPEAAAAQIYDGVKAFLARRSR